MRNEHIGGLAGDMMKIAFALAAACLLVSGAASASTVIVNDISAYPTSNSWGTFPSENTNGGTGTITTTAARSGNGSLELTGDRARVQLGNQYSFLGGPSNLGSLSTVTGLTFDWQIAGGSTNPYNVDYTPALRLLIQTQSGRKELIWEGAYNGTYGNTTRNTWYSSGINDKFYITGGSVNQGQTIAQWASQLSGATVSGFSVGVGGGATTGYHAFVDDVTYLTNFGSTTYNFEVAGGPGAVPEPGTWAMMLLGLGGLGFIAYGKTKTFDIGAAAIVTLTS